MKNYSTLFKVVLVLGLLGSLVFARELDNQQFRAKTYSPMANGPALTTLNINNIQVWVGRAADMPASGANGASGDYPKGTTNLIFAEGLVWGVRIYDGLEPELRVNGATYTTGMKAGKVMVDGSGKATGATDPDDHHVWRVRSDWASANLADDAAYTNQHLPGEESAGEIAGVYDQYQYDWNNWPADMGAPFDDVNGDGIYTPATWDAGANMWVNGDIPGFPGASQTLWTVANDIPYPDGREVSPTSYGSPGGGFEQQLTVWGYNFPASQPLGNIQFKRARMIYTGRPDGNADSYIDTAYFTQWSDPDLGTYTDDLVGFDTTLSLGYVYNGNTLDATYNGTYGMAVPAGGYDFLQGPKVDGVPLGMTTSGWFGAGAPDSDPDLGEYEGTLQWFNLMEGYRPIPSYPDREPWLTNDTGVETKFPLAGDPVTGTGDIDGINLTPGDRRMLMNSGPFAMALGDTQDVVIALIGATGGDNLSSITVLKYYDVSAQFAYDNAFDLPSPPVSPKVEVFSDNGAVMLNWGGDVNAVSATEDAVQKGFEFQGYKVYQLPSAQASAEDGELLAIYDRADGVITITEKVVDAQSGLVLDLPRHIGSDGGIVRYLEIDTDEIRNRPLTNDIPYYFGVSAYSYLEDNAASPFKSLESNLTTVTVRPQMAAPGSAYGHGLNEQLEVTHASGGGTGSVDVFVIDPSVTRESNYSVKFADDGSTWSLFRGSAVMLSNRAHPDATYSPGTSANDAPIVDGLQVQVYNPAATSIASWDYIGNRWISGTNWGGSQLFGGMDLGANFFGSSEDFTYVPVELVWQDQASVDANGYAAKGAVYHRDKGYAYQGTGEMPFQAFEMDADGNHVRQLNVTFVEHDEAGVGNGNLIWDMGWDGTAFAPLGGREYTFINATTYNEGADYNGDNDGTFEQSMYAFWPGQRGSRVNLLAEFTLQIYPAVAAMGDEFTWSVSAPTTGGEITADMVKMINVFPNPYYGYHDLETARRDKFMTFNHLPQKADIRIFNMGGVMVRLIKKDDDTQNVNWDLTNEYGYPVASGIYVAHVDLPDVGKEKILKIALVQEEQILLSY